MVDGSLEADGSKAENQQQTLVSIGRLPQHQEIQMAFPLRIQEANAIRQWETAECICKCIICKCLAQLHHTARSSRNLTRLQAAASVDSPFDIFEQLEALAHTGDLQHWPSR